jgi:peptidoglycan hydrolase-like protein with peptidoglycan-binding domain
MTIEQAQCLLKYLGYYVGAIDGKNGTFTKVATKAFQKDFGGIAVDGVIGPKTEKALKHAVAYGMTVKTTSDFWDEIKYFKRSEFACKCRKFCDGFPAEPKEKLIRVADRVREHFGKPATVSSGVRCTQHNANVVGVSNSRHLQGKAMDFSVSGVSGSTLLSYVQNQPEIRYAYLIDGNWVHMDIE